MVQSNVQRLRGQSRVDSSPGYSHAATSWRTSLPRCASGWAVEGSGRGVQVSAAAEVGALKPRPGSQVAGEGPCSGLAPPGTTWRPQLLDAELDHGLGTGALAPICRPRVLGLSRRAPAGRGPTQGATIQSVGYPRP